MLKMLIYLLLVEYCKGPRTKPVPPPRSHSLETFGPKCLRIVDDISTNDDSTSATSTSQDNSESSTPG